jgi:hypothetical protein
VANRKYQAHLSCLCRDPSTAGETEAGAKWVLLAALGAKGAARIRETARYVTDGFFDFLSCNLESLFHLPSSSSQSVSNDAA